MERGRIKERRESFISYSREDLFDKDRIKKCGHEQSKCNCAAIKQELAETLTKNNEAQALRSKSETRMPQKSKAQPQTNQQRRNSEQKDIENSDLCPVEVQRYNSKTLPKRIANLKNKKKLKETNSTFYMDLPLNDDEIDDTVLKIVEKADHIDEPTPQETHFNEEFQESSTFPIKDAEIVSQLILQKQDFNKKLTKPVLSRRTSFDKSSITSFDITNSTIDSSFSSNIVSTPKAKEKTQRKESISADNSPTDEPIYESLLRNVHVPYKFAPALLRRSLSTISSTEKQELDTVITNETAPEDVEIDDDGPDCDYVTLTYSNEGLTEIDGQSIKSPSCSAIKHNELQMMSNSDTNINYCKKTSHLNLTSISPASNVDLKTSAAADNTLTNSVNNLERRESLNSRSKSFIQKFMNMRNSDSNANASNDETTSQKSVSITSRKSFDSQLSFSFKRKTSAKVETPPIYRQGSENLGNRIAHVDYADPKTLFQVNSPQSGTSSCANVNVLINKNSLKTQRDSVFSSSSDSVCDHQKNAQQQLQTVDPFSNSYYEESVEDCLENDFRDSAIYSDDSNEKRYEQNMQPDEHIYATIAKRDSVVPMDMKPPPTPPQILRKPNLTLKVSKVQSPPIIPKKPSNLKSPEVRKVIQNYRTHIASTTTSPTQPDSSKADERIKNLEDPMSTQSSSSWVLKQVQKFQ